MLDQVKQDNQSVKISRHEFITMLEYTEYIKIFIGLLAVVDPFGTIPIFVALTADKTKAELKIIEKQIVFTVAFVLLFALFLGEHLLTFFGISIHSFAVGGGIVLLMLAISMLQAKVSGIVQNRQEAEETEESDSIAIVPLSIPLLAGPGAISAVILYAHQGANFDHSVMMAVEIIAVCVILWLVLRSIPWLSRYLDRTWINILTRIIGMLLVALAVEFIASGLKGLFPVLVS